VVHSLAFPMRLRHFVALVAVPSAVVLAASCAPFAASFDLGSGATGSSGAGGAPYDVGDSAGTTTGIGAGGSEGFTSGGAGGSPSPMTPSYQYLCGGSHATCQPGAKTDICAQGGNPGMGGSPPDASAVSCQLVAADGGTGITAQCGTSGSSTDGDPCMSAADCGPELGCISGLTPICRTYCCDSLESCPSETYCVTSPMNEPPYAAIPVCIPAMTCVLLDDATCPAGLTCAIVRASGTTSCIVPGTGTTGQACPCAAGFTCSAADDTCLQLCHTGTDECGSNGFCQGGTKPYPDGIGYCVSY
jgi:hypothetical protein